MRKDEQATKIGPGVYLHPNGDITIRTAIRFSFMSKADRAVIYEIKENLARGLASRLKVWIKRGLTAEPTQEQPSEK